MIEEHKKLLLPTIIRGVLYGLVVATLLVNVPSLLGIKLSSEVYAEKITKMNEMETKRRKHSDKTDNRNEKRRETCSSCDTKHV